eukprot:TRINITY_DN13265_c0_g1_i1.p2 TRINITY_DN13265_c0_g1~~TRINITY_DN13265_c0_g1_i1.p2  ORF type:complete len:205 (+),score=32.66 TRINITY_DN13265_c0_g1_i1:289-903(+)
MYSIELERINEKIKEASHGLSKAACQSIGKIKNPSPDVIEILEKFMIVLDQKETNWKLFQLMAKNYESLRGVMNNYDPLELSEEQINHIMPLLKNYAAISARIGKVNKHLIQLLDWMTGSLERKLKYETLTLVKQNLHETLRNLKTLAGLIAERNSHLMILEEITSNLRVTHDMLSTQSPCIDLSQVQETLVRFLLHHTSRLDS